MPLRAVHDRIDHEQLGTEVEVNWSVTDAWWGGGWEQ